MINSVSSIVINHILEILKSRYNITINVEDVDIKIEALKNDRARVDISKLKALFSLAMQKSKDENLALNIGSTIHINTFGILGYIMSNSRTLKEALQNLQKYHFTIGKMLIPKLSILEESFKLSFESNNNIRYKNELHLSAIYKILKEITQDKLKPKYVYFSHSKPENIDRYIDIFTDRIYFQKDENALIFDIRLLNLPIAGNNPALLNLFIKEAESISNNIFDVKFQNIVYKMIIERLDREIPSIEEIARELNISSRTLQSRLKNENQSFSDILLKAKKELSKYYFENTQMSISQIADSLGYFQLSSFNRAFKSWFGIAPSQYRKNKTVKGDF
jgi:AraC-like DNA-binding protein